MHACQAVKLLAGLKGQFVFEKLPENTKASTEAPTSLACAFWMKNCAIGMEDLSRSLAVKKPLAVHRLQAVKQNTSRRNLSKLDEYTVIYDI